MESELRERISYLIHLFDMQFLRNNYVSGPMLLMKEKEMNKMLSCSLKETNTITKVQKCTEVQRKEKQSLPGQSGKIT